MRTRAVYFNNKLWFTVLFILLSLFIYQRFLPPVETAAPQKTADEFPADYDIRTDKDTKAKNVIASLIDKSAMTDAEIEVLRKKTIQAEKRLREKIPDLKVEYNLDLRIPEVISPEIKTKNGVLTSPTSEKRADVLKDLIRENIDLFGVDETQLAKLRKTADYTNPNGVLSYVHFEQEIGGVPVFRGEVKAGFTKQNEIIRVINNLAPQVDDENVSDDFGNVENSLQSAIRHLGIEPKTEDLQRKNATRNELKITFERGQFEDETTAEKMYFPLAPGVARPAWRVLLWTKESAFYVIVEADSGVVMWHKNITDKQTQPATYNVYGNTTSMMKTADSVSPFSPGCLTPTGCPQPPAVERTNFTLVGNEPPYTFNNTGWIPDGDNRSIGNAVEAGIDRLAPNGVDPDGWAFGNPNRVFSYAYNPGPGNPPPGENPLPTTQTYPPSQYQQGSVTHAFYAINRWHDETYRLGFTEASRNFQVDNFGRGGTENDSISAEIQDGSGTNGANFSTPADGGRPRMQMFIWTGPDPDRDGGLDSQVVIHEVTHGLSNRLHGNSSGLGTNMARGMGEGWSDFYHIALMAEPADDRLGTYNTGSYITHLITPGFEGNYYYAIRRYPTAVLASTGGINNKPHNAFTFSYINSDCNPRLNTDNFAFPRGPIGTTICDQVHNLGEIWSTILWEVRDKLIEKNGAADGNRRVLQYVTDGMKLSPLNPTMIQSRDAIIAAAFASDQTDAVPVWQGFSLRGIGFSASIQNTGSGNNNTVVTEAFDTPNVTMTNPFSVVEAQGDGDSLPEMGEIVAVTVTLTNTTGATINNVSASVQNGFSANYGNVANGQTISRQINYYVPRYSTCDPFHQITIRITSDAGTSSQNRSFRIFPLLPGSVFTNSTQINIPASGAANPYPSVITVSGVSGGRRPVVELTNVSHTFTGDIDVMLEGPGGQKYVFFSDVLGAADSVSTTYTLNDTASSLLQTTGIPASGEYKPTNYTTGDTFPSPAPASPYSEASPAGTATFASTFPLNSAMNGDWKLWVVDDADSDSGTIGSWKLTLEQIICVDIFPTAMPPNFDNDLTTDLGVFRPSDGNWYLLRSTSGFTAINWGLATDRLAPGDYDGDQKTDTTVFRNGNWLILNSSNNTFTSINWGLDSDILTAGDYDGDGKTDAAVFRPSDGVWYIRNSANGSLSAVNFGQNGDVPVPADYDGDFRTDAAVYRSGTWYLQQSFFGFKAVSFGVTTDKPVPMDYDGDGRADIAVFRPSNGTWYRINSTNEQFSAVHFGQNGDLPVPGDYDGDRRADQAVFRNGIWYLNRSDAGFQAVSFGLAGDKPIPAAYIP